MDFAGPDLDVIFSLFNIIIIITIIQFISYILPAPQFLILEFITNFFFTFNF